MTFYGNLFLTPDQQGQAIDLTEAQRDLADDIAVEWLTNALDSTRPATPAPPARNYRRCSTTPPTPKGYAE
ncbi:hypothetical protein [Solwaraspora sp. WMMA2065]|uniref:hypothetical protein n=1 Tax=Solwaraspora sp. WMMA2065 TaxID=3015166 RepID=UPI00259BF1F6|nr:hypothetical protein [Solwaraspora sp. WMMA2065]WJK33050.1 hypothetical protein O7610_20305 [Solwaraspora sp. WMMA2065]